MRITAGFLVNAPADSGRGARRAMTCQPSLWGWLARLLPASCAEAVMRRLPMFLLDYGRLPAITCPDGTIIDVRILAVPFTSRALIDSNHRYFKVANSWLVNAPSVLAKRHLKDCPIPVLGLGAATAIASGHGREIFRQHQNNNGNFRVITSGNTITAGLSVAIAKEALGSKRVRSIGVFGGLGSVGSRTLELAIEEFRPRSIVFYLNPGSTTKNNGSELTERVERDYGISILRGSMKHTVSCDLVFMASSSTVPFAIHPSWPKTGAVIVDIGKPLNSSRELAKLRPDLKIIDGSLAYLSSSVDWSKPCQRMALPKNAVFGCLAETIVLAHQYGLGSLSQDIDTATYIGRPDASQANTMMTWLSQAGLTPAVVPAHR